MSQPLIPPPGKPFDLSRFDPRYDGGLDKEASKAELARLAVRIDELQNTLYAAKSHAVLIVTQGIDTSGKDGLVKDVFQVTGPIGCSVVSFGVPTAEELAHDYLWRYRKEMPRRGNIVVFNRSYYESVLVERVKGIAPEKVWTRRYGEINDLERFLIDNGTVILKFFLHISKDEQRERLQERVDNPKKHWKFNLGDLEERKLWDDYQAAFQDMVAHCNTEIAPWHVVPADRNWYRNLVVAQAIVAKLESLDLKYPLSTDDLTGVKVV
ncbi:MAG: polyphosphate kinase 2 family protein [Dehalococcoidia bacterium]